MNNNFFRKLLYIIKEENNKFNTIVEMDNLLGLNVTSDEIINYLEFTNSEQVLNGPIVGNTLITEGDILSVLKILHDINNLEGEYKLFINGDNIGTITYLVNKANNIYKELDSKIVINIDYNSNYNDNLNSLVSIIGSSNFVNNVALDFPNANKILV